MPEVIELDLDLELAPEVWLRVLTPPDQLPLDLAQVIVGLAGPPGGTTYIHTQTIAAAVWTVAHNLGRRPSVAITDHLGNQIWPDVRWVDDNLVQVTHGTPLTGFAYCN